MSYDRQSSSFNPGTARRSLSLDTTLQLAGRPDASEVGRPLDDFGVEGLLQSQRNGWQQAEKVLALLATYRTADFQAALERAVRYGAFSLSTMQRILAVQAQPKSCLEHLAEEAVQQLPDILRTPATTPRPLADYQPLLFPETDRHDQQPQHPTPVDEQTTEQESLPDRGQPEAEADGGQPA